MHFYLTKNIDKTTYELEYDSKDNWIKKIIYEDDKPTNISEREIEYYD